jgi:hypothetical protein
MKNKKIKFISAQPDYDIPKPVPASRLVPEWYRKMPGANKQIETVKKCVPFLDALTSGYIITLPVDVYWNEEDKSFLYSSQFEIESDHDSSQTEHVKVDEGLHSQPHKWINRWEIRTPKGYSCLFIHPLERTDLPFYSFSGIVDTDKHPLVVNFPFLMKKGFSGLIPAGTPIIQIIPFKRDRWESVIIDDKEYNRELEEYRVQNPPFSYYKRTWWTKKEYR